ncbi:hypothetical protein ACIREO_23090 [Streptomyces sp. NPDC102441]|uniref:hypothetical protein n=1 Tax=Streptomyces sp. NPDC102441 TaxID=3366176 RepID=UPI0037F1A7CB
MRREPPVGGAGFHGHKKLLVCEAVPQRTDIASDVDQLVDGAQAQRQAHTDGVVSEGKRGRRLLSEAHVPRVAAAL